jgi:hypothetical protein
VRRTHREGGKGQTHVTYCAISHLSSDLDHEHDFFQFRIWDRNNLTTRQSDWLMRHRAGISMYYRLHEVLVYPVEEPSTKELGWEVYEVETPTSWHVTAGHGHSQSYRRYQFDLDLLERDLRDEGSSPSDHTLYYLGITSFAAVEAGAQLLEDTQADEAAKRSFKEEAQRRIEQGLYYLQQRVEAHIDSEYWEQTWAAMRWIAYAYQVGAGVGTAERPTDHSVLDPPSTRCCCSWCRSS